MKSTRIKYVFYRCTALFPLSVIYILSGNNLALEHLQRHPVEPEYGLKLEPLPLLARLAAKFQKIFWPGIVLIH